MNEDSYQIRPIVLKWPLASTIASFALTLAMSALAADVLGMEFFGWSISFAQYLPGVARVITPMLHASCDSEPILARSATSLVGLIFSGILLSRAAIEFPAYQRSLTIPSRGWAEVIRLTTKIGMTVFAIIGAASFHFVWFYRGTLALDRKIDCGAVLTASYTLIEVPLILALAQYSTLLCLRAVCRSLKRPPTLIRPNGAHNG